MATVQQEYRSRMKATPQKKTIWIVVHDPPHSDYASDFPDLDHLAARGRSGCPADDGWERKRTRGRGVVVQEGGLPA